MDIPLRSCGGAAPPLPVVEGWKQYLELSDPVQLDVWKLVVDSLATPDDANKVQQRVEAVSAVHDVSAGDVVAASLACQVLLGGACAQDLTREEFEQDLKTLSEGRTDGLEVILSRYDLVKAELRHVEDAQVMADHGKVLENVEWRLDKIVSSSRGYHRESDVIFLTIDYREGNTPGRMTFQVSARGLQSLKRFMARFQS